MKLLIKDRGTGKTTGLIYTSESTGYPIVVHDKNSVSYVKKQAKGMGCIIPDPIALNDLRGNFISGFIKPNRVLVDEIGFILEDALTEYLGVKIECATMTDSIKERETILLHERKDYEKWIEERKLDAFYSNNPHAPRM